MTKLRGVPTRVTVAGGLALGYRLRVGFQLSGVGVREMKLAKSFVVGVLTLALVASASVVLAAGRLALVVGNSTYAHLERLPNPENDATDIAETLQRLGFKVTIKLDADRKTLNAALRAFASRSAGADVALVFYAGHGTEMNGVNYLVPVDASLNLDTEMRFETVTLDDVLASTLGARLRLVILDACRNNRLASSMQRTDVSRSVSGGSFGALDPLLLGDETLGGVCSGGGNDGGGRAGPEQPVHGGVAVVSGRAVGDHDAVPSGSCSGAGVDKWSAASARVSVAGGRTLP